jgi:hypothetical protein
MCRPRNAVPMSKPLSRNWPSGAMSVAFDAVSARRGMQTRWAGRWQTLSAMGRIVFAQLLIRFVSLRRWRASLGQLRGVAAPDAGMPGASSEARARARRAVRAAARLPIHSKCLPRAMALQWMMRDLGQASTLVIAVRRGHREDDPHNFHAWVEQGGEMIIGKCDRSDYSPVMALALPGN